MKKQGWTHASADSLLESMETGIEEVLQWPEVVQAARKGYPALIKYMQGQHFSELIDYVIEEPEELGDGRLAAQLPYIAVEMLVDSPDLLNLFFADPSYLDHFFSFLRQPSLSPTLAGYFSSISQSLLSHNSQDFLSYLFLHSTSSTDLLTHISTKSIQELLLKLLRSDLGMPQFALERMDLIDLLSQNITDETESVSVLLHSEAVLMELIAAGKEVQGWGVYMSLLLQRKVVLIWCSTLVSENYVAVTAALRLITALLNLQDFDKLVKINFLELNKAIRKKLGRPIPSDLPDNTVASPHLITNLLPLLPFLLRFLSDSSLSIQLKIATIDLIAALSGSSLPEVTSALIASGVYTEIVNLFSNTPWASLLHTSFDSFVTKIITSLNLTLKKHLILTSKLPQMLSNLSLFPYIFTSKGGKMRKGQMGYVTKIGNLLVCNDNLQEIMKDLYKENWWTEFLTGFLLCRTGIEGRKLGEKEESEEDTGEVLTEMTNVVGKKEGSEGKKEVKIPEMEEIDTSEDDSLVEEREWGDLCYWKVPVLVEGDLPALE